MGIFKKTINHSKPSYKINEKLEMLDTELKKTGIFYGKFDNSLCLEESVDSLDPEDVKYNWRDDLGIVNIISEETDTIENGIIGEHFSQRFKSSQVRIDELIEQVDILQKELFLQLNKTELNCSELVDDKFSSVLEFEHQLRETKKEISNIDQVYRNLFSIVESRKLNEDEILEECSNILEQFNREVVTFENRLNEQISDYSEKHLKILDELNQNIGEVKNHIAEQLSDYDKTVHGYISDSSKKLEKSHYKFSEIVENKLNDYQIQSNGIDKRLSDTRADILVNQQHLKKVERYIEENHQDLVKLKEEVFNEIDQIPVGNIQENLERLEKKIDYIKETYSRIEPEVIVKEVINEGLLNEPPDVKNSDPLTPLDQKFVTLDQLQEHYRLFINRIQQQLSTLGGGGETQLRYLDDIVGIATNSNSYDGKYLRWNSVTNKAEFAITDYSVKSGVATSVIGGIGSISQLTINGNTLYGSLSVSTNSTSVVGIHSELSILDYRSVEYCIQATQGNNFQAVKILSIHDGTIAYNSEYANIFNNVSLADYDIDISGGNIRLHVIPASSLTTTYKINFTSTKI
jgi:ferritin-like metal-binding protein YciE